MRCAAPRPAPRRPARPDTQGHAAWPQRPPAGSGRCGEAGRESGAGAWRAARRRCATAGVRRALGAQATQLLSCPQHLLSSAPCAQRVAKLLQEARLLWWDGAGGGQGCGTGPACACRCGAHTAPLRAQRRHCLRPSPTFSMVSQSSTCLSIHRREKEWLWALQGDTEGAGRGGVGWAPVRWSCGYRETRVGGRTCVALPWPGLPWPPSLPARHSHIPVVGPQVHAGKVNHGQAVLGNKVLPSLGRPVCRVGRLRVGVWVG